MEGYKMIKNKVFRLIVVLAFVVFISSYALAKEATVSGTVMYEDGQAATGIKVTLADRSAVTDGTGEFSFADIDQGEYVLSVMASSLKYQKDISVLSGQSDEFDFVKPKPVNIAL